MFILRSGVAKALPVLDGSAAETRLGGSAKDRYSGGNVGRGAERVGETARQGNRA